MIDGVVVVVVMYYLVSDKYKRSDDVVYIVTGMGRERKRKELTVLGQFSSSRERKCVRRCERGLVCVCIQRECTYC